ncbi:transaldolase [Bordetella sp. 02P26C-1]|uniref:transaldolase n=1 Tax=Bordetella sp. 02P26C-1 TaxID=2683195 RepID=UPI0013552A3F|nr:transaldolase [Bordetella sp. 02P26C-1]MVW79885.1 transaldolase [Bordetella sp. 02P26C-1]
MLESLAQTSVQPSVQPFGPVLRRSAANTAIHRQQVHLPVELKDRVISRLKAMREQRWVSRLWAGDATLWTGTDEDQWTGWVNPAQQQAIMRRYLGMCARLRDGLYEHAVLIGMGGASVGAQVLQSALGSSPGGLKLHVLDSIDPDQVQALERRLPLDKCLYIVASKSGTTMESTLLARHFYQRARAALGESAGRHFCAITDLDTPLQKMAEELGYAAVFTGDSQIGGRYSVLSPFGLVPLALMGHDPMAYLNQASVARNQCGPRAPMDKNPGAILGAVLGEAALSGRDKVTIWTDPKLACFGDWLEQLIAESTGKHGRGMIPVTQEPETEVHRYPSDRLFVILRRGPAMKRQTEQLRAAGHAVIDIEVGEGALLAQEFYRWQFATAVAGSILEINPFDQPDVEASKVRTRQVLAAPIVQPAGVSLGSLVVDIGEHADLGDWLRAHPADYFSLLAYLPSNDDTRAWLTHWQGRLRDMYGAAATSGYGPRYLHASGQLHKGGPAGGSYLFIGRHDCHGNELGRCQSAQAQADIAELRARGRHCAAVWFTGSVATGLRDLAQLLESALGVDAPVESNAALAH